MDELSVGAADCSLQWQSQPQKQSTWPQLRQPGRHFGSRDCWVTLASKWELRERVSRKEVCFAYCSTDEMVADGFTKPLPVSKFRFCLSGMGVA